MSLLDLGNETVTVYPHINTTDSDGNTVVRPSASGTDVVARVQPASSSDIPVDGQQMNSFYVVIARDAPAASWSYCLWRGQKWDVVGEIMRSRGSTVTEHVTWNIQRRVGGTDG